MTEIVIVVEAAGRAGRWACRSLRHAGFRVVGTVGSDRAARASRGECDAVRRVPSPQTDAGGFVAALTDVVEREGAAAVMQSDSEGATQLLTGLVGRVPAVVVGPDAEQFQALCDKSTLVETLEEVGLESPRTVVVGAGGGAPAELPPPPCIVKPVAARTGAAQHEVAQGSAVAHDERERDELVRDLVARTGAAVVQEQIVGKAWRVHFVASRSAFASLPVLTRLTFPREAGMSTVQYVPREAPREIFDAAELLVRHVGYVGPGSIQFLERAGSFYVHDVNLRLPASVAISMKAGLDMPALAVECALGREDGLARAAPRRDVTYVWLGGEVRALLHDLPAPTRAPGAVGRFASAVGGAVLRPSHVLDQASVWARLTGGLASLVRR